MIKRDDTYPHPLLGVVITNSNPLSDLLHEAISHVCITHNSKLHICGPPSHGLSIYLHAKPTTIPDTQTLAKAISTRHNPIHDSSKYKIVRNIRIHQNALLKPEYLLKASGSLADCIGFLPDFSHGIANLRLTALFTSSRNTSFLCPDSVSLRIIEANATVVNLTPAPPLTPLLPPTSLRSSGSAVQSPPRGHGRGASRTTMMQDRSGALYRVQANSALRINATTPSHKFYVVINRIGGLATSNIYAMNFDNDGVRMLITHVPFSLHRSFPTYPEAWSYFTLYYVHITTPDDATFMNINCPAESSNLNNPCPRFQEIQGLNFTPPACNTRAFVHYADLTQDIRDLRDASSRRMKALACTLIDGYTFLPDRDPDTARWLHRQQHASANFSNDATTYTQPVNNGHAHNPLHRDRSRHPHPQDDASMHDQSTTHSSFYTHPHHDDDPATYRATANLPNDDDSATCSSADLLSDTGHKGDEIEGLLQDSANLYISNTTKKRSRHESHLSTTTHETARSETFITFNVTMETSERDIFDDLVPVFEQRSVPDDAYLPSIRFHGYPSIYNMVEKHATITCTDTSFADTIVDVIRGTIASSYAYKAESVPPDPVPADIDIRHDATRPPTTILSSTDLHISQPQKRHLSKHTTRHGCC